MLVIIIIIILNNFTRERPHSNANRRLDNEAVGLLEKTIVGPIRVAYCANLPILKRFIKCNSHLSSVEAKLILCFIQFQCSTS